MRLDLRLVKIAPALLLILPVLAACASNDAVQGAYYPMGFTDGCRTAESRQASFSRKEYKRDDLFKTEDSYRAGWRSGFAQCDRMSDLGNRPGDLGENNPF